MLRYDFTSPANAQFPSMVVLAINNVCEFECVHCYHPFYRQQSGFRQYNMTVEIFHKIADELGRFPGSALRFLAWGEPLLHPQIVEFTQYAHRVAPHNPLTLITNGYWLSPDLSLSLMQAGLSLVEISIDAATSESYNQIRKSHHANGLERIEENIRQMLAKRICCDFKTRIVVSFILHPTEASAREFALFEAKWTGIVDEIVKRPAHTFKGTIAGTPLPTPRIPCYGLWHRCNINMLGQISVCYQDWENNDVIGDLRSPETTIAKVWQGEAFNRLRENQRKGIFEGICSNCQDYNCNAWNNPYEKVVERC